MNRSESIGELAKALALAQSAMKAAEMNAVNPFLKNKYADLGSIIAAARQPLADNELSFTQLVGGGEGQISVETCLLHSSGEWLSSEITLPIGEDKGRSLAQNAGAIITYLRRYSLAAMLGIYADEDADGEQKKTAKIEKPAEAKEANEPPPAEPSEPKKNGGNGKKYDLDAIYQAVVDEKLSQNTHTAKVALDKCKTGYDTAEKAIAWMRLYRGWRDMEKTPQEAGDLANKGAEPK